MIVVAEGDLVKVNKKAHQMRRHSSHSSCRIYIILAITCYLWPRQQYDTSHHNETRVGTATKNNQSSENDVPCVAMLQSPTAWTLTTVAETLHALIGLQLLYTHALQSSGTGLPFLDHLNFKALMLAYVLKPLINEYRAYRYPRWKWGESFV